MSYSPIIVPAVALTLWFLTMSLAGLVPLLKLAVAESFDPPPSDEDWRRATENFVQQAPSSREFPGPFYVLCLALAHMGAGSALASWLAWVYAVSLAVFNLPISLCSRQLRCGACMIANISIYALAAVAGFALFAIS